MHIKQVIIQGFKSYCEQTVVEPFDKRHNVIVGRNGAGKSNFFYAIQFVLSDEFTNLRSEQRLALIHEGTGNRVVSAFVEIVFDNSDRRIPIEEDEIFLRRVIAFKKDQFFLNKKVMPRSEVFSLLETAGLSSSNPYYIVKQGKINVMATAPDSHRLQLLREVAGTKVFDERREESFTLLKECFEKAEKMQECLQTIDERLKILEEEKKELKEFEECDKARRVLEFVIHDTEHRKNKEKLEELHAMRANRATEQQDFAAVLQEVQKHVEEANRKLREVCIDLAAAHEESYLLITEQQQLLVEKAKLELAIKDLSNDVDGDIKSKEIAEGKLELLQQEISENNRELEELKPKYEEMKAREEECARALSLNQQKREELYVKQGRSMQFTSKQDRDMWIEKELESLNKQIKDKKDYEAKLLHGICRDANRFTELEKGIEETTKEMERQRVALEEHNKQYNEFKKRKDQEQNARNELWRKETPLTSKLSSLKDELARADQELHSMVGKPILNGRDSVRKVLETFQERGGKWAEIVTQYYGPVIENFTCEDIMYTAVEVTAGKRLFHHIVESDKVGTEILKEMNRQGLPGEVTFMPLNRLRVRHFMYPDDDDNSVAMIEKMTYDDRCATAMRYIFGRTLICRTFEFATEFREKFQLDCVTLEGDQLSTNGLLSGGYYSPSRSILEKQNTRSKLMENVTTVVQDLITLRQELNNTESSISSMLSEMQRTETKQEKAMGILDRVKADIALMKEEIASIERVRGPQERLLAACRSSLEAMQATKEGLECELREELLEQLSTADQGKIGELNEAIRRLTQRNKEAFCARMNLEATKNKLENLLTNNLIRRKDELVQALQEVSVEDRQRRLANRKSDLAANDARIKCITKQLEDVEKKVDSALKVKVFMDIELAAWERKEKEAQDKIEEDIQSLDMMASKEVLLQHTIKEYEDKIEALGTLSNARHLLAKYRNMSPKQLLDELEKTNQHLKKYNHVNKKAMDQFTNLCKQKTMLLQKKKELDDGSRSMQQLIETLEHGKLEAIQFTYRQVCKNFTDVFKKLVPQGRANLIMRINEDDVQDAVAEIAEPDTFTGVGIKVSFTNDEADMTDMEQLSGGQKALVALALIFAIQKCDPAPFYLFDEVDQSLDARHRKAVADLIHEMSSTTQFITTTFMPELLEQAHKFYGVKFRNNASRIVCLTRERARTFVEDSATHDTIIERIRRKSI